MNSKIMRKKLDMVFDMCQYAKKQEKKIMDIAHVKKLIRQIESRKNKIGKIRDKLHRILDDLEDSVCDIEQGVYDLNEGIESIKSAIEDISQTM